MTSELVLHIKKSTTIPIIITIIISAVLTLIAIISGEVYQEAVIFPEAIGGATFGLFNALFYLGFGIVGGFLIFLIIKYGKMQLLRAILFTSFLILTIMIIIFYGYFLMVIFNINYFDIPLTIISIVLGILITYQLFSENASERRKNTSLLFIGGGLGSFLGIWLPSWTTFMMLALFSIWDIYAVKKGPIKQIVELNRKDEENYMKQLSFGSEEWEIGLGDLVFYTLLTAHILYNSRVPNSYFSFLMSYGIIISLLPFFASIIGVLIGVKITFKLLRKRKMLPGLPISIGLGISFFLLSLLIIVLFLKPTTILIYPLIQI
ncbi:MAG: hypothetical protein HWN67_04080 [Candidatus Helarchaeota archaeon]|nr:hypothetical protein [Candidatus Helarchaeota archaeon]